MILNPTCPMCGVSNGHKQGCLILTKLSNMNQRTIDRSYDYMEESDEHPKTSSTNMHRVWREWRASLGMPNISQAPSRSE